MNKNLLLLLLILSLIVSCVQPETVKSVSPSNDTVNTSCDVSGVDESLTDPESITELINLINALPRPLTADCLLKSLKRPLYVNATSSKLSAQPADSYESPRIFIFKGNLIISVVATGNGSKLLEFSEMVTALRSKKGELVLPIEYDVAQSDPFIRVNFPNRTSCSGCHTSEQVAGTVEGIPVYTSVAFRPQPSEDVSLDYLKDSHYLCQAQMSKTQLCTFWDGLFSHGNVIAKDFPSDMIIPSNTFGL